jgi:type IV pilus assembly protein PilY1
MANLVGRQRVTSMLVGCKALALVAALLVLFIPSVMADECTIQVTTPGVLGKNKTNQTYTFDELDRINRVVSFTLKKPTHVCGADSYSYNANRLTVKNNKLNPLKCKAQFTVEGQQAGCTSSTPDSEIAQIPLFLTQQARPNILYILDDSGSMQFELMPSEIIGGSSRYIFPRTNGVHGSSDYSNYVPTVDSNNPYNARSRSPQVNTVYYNPSTTYEPWIKADGSSYPNANILCAPHAPLKSFTLQTLTNCRNLTINNSNFNGNSWVSCDKSGSCSRTSSTKTFWPATYFWYKGSGDMWQWANYEKVEIRPGLDYVGHGRESRDDCLNANTGSCTYLEEIQNFANWYTYYRSRVGTARAGSGFAFAEQGKNIRMGFGSLNSSKRNLDGVETTVIRRGVRTFEGVDRDDFFDELYGLTIPAKGTPLRKSLDAAGEYYQRRDNKGPWGGTPGTDDGKEQTACRRNYTVMVTDGYWSGGKVGGDPGDNNDGEDNPSHSSPVGMSYTYKATPPFSDSRDDTLADVAMYYWKNDLRSDLENVVSVNKRNPAFWQHMVTFGVGLGVTGTINPDSAFSAIETGATINWPDPESAQAHKIDDLLHASVNSRGGFFSAANPEDFATELSDALQAIVNEGKSSASAVAANSTRLDSGSLVYQASFNSLEWSGRLLAYELNDDGSIGDVKWDSTRDSFPAESSRNLFTSVGGLGDIITTATSFTLTNWLSLDLAQRTLLNNGASELLGKGLLSWVRGDRSGEGTAFRRRSGVLGDIINSDPAFVGNEDDYGFQVLSGSEGDRYQDFMKAKKSWPSILLVGANDGMLHGFDAQTGKEYFGYIPVAVYPNLPNLASVDYQHQYYVDGSPRVSDAYLNGAWKTVAVASTGAGGRSVFAIDVSNPSTITAQNFLWEFSTAADADHKLGVAMSEPTVARVDADNKWIAVFGNGYESGDTVKLMIVDLETGELIRAIDTEVSGVNNGLATPVPVDVDSDRITDFVYAGDLQGNLWKFDVRGSDAADWHVAYKSGNSPAPLFVAVDDGGERQPITMRPTVGNHDDGGYYVYFGTGQFFKTNDSVVGPSPQVQEFYGIHDDGKVINRGDLLAQDVIYEEIGTLKEGGNTKFQVRLVTANGADSVPAAGWRLPLQPPNDAKEGERSVSQPILRNGRIIFTTLIPTQDVCGFGGRSWLMEVDAQTGGRYKDPVLDTNSDGMVDELDVILYNGEYLPISGRGSDEIIKTPGIVSKGEIEYKYTSGSSGTVGVVAEKGDGGGIVGRQSWRQMQ